MKQPNLFSSESFSELCRFAFVGVLATMVHYGVYWLLKHWINYNWAYTLGYAVSFVGNFFLTSYFTFRKKATVGKGFGFGGVHVFNYLFQMLLLNVTVGIGVSPSVAPLFVYGIAVPIQFLMVRFVFRK